ncbi:YhgN family NAAT transporter [Endozoicomonadaceae bacterium StTr2]
MDIFASALMLFLIMDPLGNTPIFLSILKNVPPERRRKVLIRELLIALGILFIFLFAGQQLLDSLNLRQETVSISGGIILFLIAIRLIFPPERGSLMGDTPDGEPMIVPLATPLIVGPSVLAALILLSNQHPNEYPALMAAVLLAWGGVAVILLLSNRLYKLIGERGLFAMERLMGMLLIMIAVQMLLDGLRVYLL